MKIGRNKYILRLSEYFSALKTTEKQAVDVDNSQFGNSFCTGNPSRPSE